MALRADSDFSLHIFYNKTFDNFYSIPYLFPYNAFAQIYIFLLTYV